jgi:hypothetical protein
MNGMSPRDLQQHMAGTYFALRVGLVVIGWTLPFLLWIGGGLVHGLPLQGSMSAYYNTDAAVASRVLAPRDLFVGLLFATGACLYLYKGFSAKENVALNGAGALAALVALFPTAPAGAGGGRVTLHGTFAVLFFACIAYVTLRRAADTLDAVRPEHRDRYRRTYRLIGALMLLSPAAAVAVSYLADAGRVESTRVFWVEAFAVWTFAAYWTAKTVEMRETHAEERALDAELRRTAEGRVVPDGGGASRDGGAAHGRSGGGRPRGPGGVVAPAADRAV